MSKIFKHIIVVLLITINHLSIAQSIDKLPLHSSLSIESKYVKEKRIINIWLPESYNQSNTRYPVLYMPDGGIKEDFPHIANTIAKLVKTKLISPIILVGIENTMRCRDLTGYSESSYDAQFCPQTDGAKNFRAFISNELMPEINQRYRTTNRKGIIGESLSGLFVMETLFLKPASFDFYIAMDPSLWWDDHFLTKNIKRLITRLPDNKLKLWFAGSGGPSDVTPYAKEIRKALEQNAPKNLTWKYSDEPNEKHNTIFRATKEKALIWTLNISK